MKSLFRRLQHRPRAYLMSLIGFMLLLVGVVAAVSYLPRQTARAAVPD